MAFLAFWDSFQFRNVYILCNLLFFAFYLYVKKVFKKIYKPIRRQTFPSKHSGCAKTYVRLSGTGTNVVQTCQPLSWLVHGTSTFLTRKITETVKNWLQIAVELVFLPLTFAMQNLPVFGRFWQLQLTMCYYALIPLSSFVYL